jgi:hypothetical protein
MTSEQYKRRSAAGLQVAQLYPVDPSPALPRSCYYRGVIVCIYHLNKIYYLVYEISKSQVLEILNGIFVTSFKSITSSNHICLDCYYTFALALLP